MKFKSAMDVSNRAVRMAMLLLALHWADAAHPQEMGSALTIDSPMPWEVFQRQSEKQGFVVVRGHWDNEAGEPEVNRIEACLGGESKPEANGIETKCRRIAYDAATHSFSGTLAAPAGGFYTVEIRCMHGKKQVSVQAVEHVGVGEVFVTSGQSNSTNYGEVKQTVKSGMVTTFDGKSWRIADDPQPGVQDGSSKGSFIPSFGDAMAARYRVPIGIASVGHGSTSVRQWLPKGGGFTTEPTMTKFTSEVSPGVWECDGTLFDGMMERIHELDSLAPHGKHGFRALLWHQGESDAKQKPPHEISGAEYRTLLAEVIAASRRSAGWNFPWFVAEVSYHTPAEPLSPEIRAAQASLWSKGLALEGPDTDQLTGLNRQNHGTGVHMSDMGLQAHGKLWAEKVGAWLDQVPGR